MQVKYFSPGQKSGRVPLWCAAQHSTTHQVRVRLAVETQARSRGTVLKSTVLYQTKLYRGSTRNCLTQVWCVCVHVFACLCVCVCVCSTSLRGQLSQVRVWGWCLWQQVLWRSKPESGRQTCYLRRTEEMRDRQGRHMNEYEVTCKVAISLPGCFFFAILKENSHLWLKINQ